MTHRAIDLIFLWTMSMLQGSRKKTNLAGQRAQEVSQGHSSAVHPGVIPSTWSSQSVIYRQLLLAFVCVFVITQNNDGTSSYKKCISLLPPCCLCHCVVLHVSECPRAENVTSRARDVTPQDARRKAKINIFTEENDKNNSNAQ